MSLINQMLQDLEKRRANELVISGSPLQGVTRYMTLNDEQTWLRYVTFGIIGLLLIALIILAADRYWNLFNDSTVTSLDESDNAQVIPLAPVVSHSVQETNEPTQSSNVIPLSKKSVSGSSQVAANKTEAQKVIPPQALAESRVSSDKLIIKQQHQLSSMQQAEKAYKKAYALLAKGELIAGERKLLAAIGHDGRHTQARELLAGAYIKSGRYVEAGGVLRQGLKLQPGHSMFAKLYARVLMQQNKVTAAVRVLTQHQPVLVKDPQYHALLAGLYQQVGDHKAAIKTYQDLLNVYPKNGMWWVGKGLSYEKSGDEQQAAEAYRKAQVSGSLNSRLQRYTDNRLAALRDSGFPVDDE